MALTWSDINFDEKTININKTEYNRQVTEPKTKASNRIIMLPSFIMDMLHDIKTAALNAPVKSDYVVLVSFTIVYLRVPYDKNL